MKKIIYILFILSFVFGCSKQDNAVKSLPVEEMKVLKSEKINDTLNFKNPSDIVNIEVKEISNNNFNHKSISSQKIQQVFDIALLIQKENIDFDLKNHALDYAEKLFVGKNDKQWLKEELNSLNLKNADSIQVKDLIHLNSKNITESKQNTVLKFNLYLFKDGKTSILKKTAKLQIIKEETILNGQSYFNYKTKVMKVE